MIFFFQLINPPINSSSPNQSQILVAEFELPRSCMVIRCGLLADRLLSSPLAIFAFVLSVNVLCLGVNIHTSDVRGGGGGLGKGREIGG